MTALDGFCATSLAADLPHPLSIATVPIRVRAPKPAIARVEFAQNMLRAINIVLPVLPFRSEHAPIGSCSRSWLLTC